MTLEEQTKQLTLEDVLGKDATNVKVESDDESGSDEDDDEVPTLEDDDDKGNAGARTGAGDAGPGTGGPGGAHAGGEDSEGGGKQSRSEKKARKMLLKLGLKPVPGIQRVTIRKAKNILFIIQKPEVFRHAGSDHYIVFGEAKIEDLSHTAQLQSLQNLKSSDLEKGDGFSAAAQAGLAAGLQGRGDTDKSPKIASGKTTLQDDDEGGDMDVDETGLDDNDINLVVQQANVSRAKAIRALRKNNSDIVNAIMELTM